MIICDGCIHDAVCGCEGHREEAMSFCVYKEDSLTTLLQKKMPNSMIQIFECSKCHGTNTFYVNYCAWCGRKVPLINRDEEDIS